METQTIRVTLTYDVVYGMGDPTAELDRLNNDAEYREDFMNMLLDDNLYGVTIANAEVV